MKPNPCAQPLPEESDLSAVPAQPAADAAGWEPLLDPRFASPELRALFQKKVSQKRLSPALCRRVLLELSDLRRPR